MHDPLRHHLEDLLAHARLATLLQPIVDLQHDEIFGYEAFGRVPPDSPLASPAALSGAAKRYGLLAAFDWARTWLGVATFVHLGLPGRLFVRIEPESLLDAQFQPRCLIPALNAAALSPARLVLDTGELSPCSARELGGMVQRLQAEGIRFASTGPAHGTAPAAAFTCVDVRRTAACLASGPLPALPAAPDGALVAMGVDTPSDLDAARARGIRYAQGRMIADPSPVPLRRVPEAVMRLAAA